MQAMTDRLLDLGIIGAGLAVYIPGVDMIMVNSGHADLKRTIPINDQHVFQIGSQTKMYVAVAVHILVKRGLISYDDLVEQYLPEITSLSPFNTITVTHLLTHTSGIGSFTSFLEGQAEPNYVPWPLPEYSFDDVLALARAHGVQHPPGDIMLYCDTGYVLLDKLIERVSGVSFIEFLQAEILDPLGLAETFIGSTGNWPRERKARGYYIPSTPENAGAFDAGDVSNLTWASAAGDMVASLSDMIAFAQAMMNPDNPIRVSIADFTKVRVKCWNQGPNGKIGPDLYHGPEWGLGMGRLNWGGRSQWGHRGSTFGYRSSTFFGPDNGIAVSSYMTSVLRLGDFETTRILQSESDSITAAAYFGACDILEFD